MLFAREVVHRHDHRVPPVNAFAPQHALVIPWSLKEYLRTCRVCKLYDYRRHCWLDFNGHPTTEPGLNRPWKVPLEQAKTG